MQNAEIRIRIRDRDRAYALNAPNKSSTSSAFGGFVTAEEEAHGEIGNDGQTVLFGRRRGRFGSGAGSFRRRGRRRRFGLARRRVIR